LRSLTAMAGTNDLVLSDHDVVHRDPSGSLDVHLHTRRDIDGRPAGHRTAERHCHNDRNNRTPGSARFGGARVSHRND
jgi:hypothetical protein